MTVLIVFNTQCYQHILVDTKKVLSVIQLVITYKIFTFHRVSVKCSPAKVVRQFNWGLPCMCVCVCLSRRGVFEQAG